MLLSCFRMKMSACRSSCGSKGAKHFSWHSPGAASGQNGCWCKSSDSGRRSQQGVVAGDVGSGEWDQTQKILLIYSVTQVVWHKVLLT